MGGVEREVEAEGQAARGVVQGSEEAEGFHVELPSPGEDPPDGARPLGDVMLDFSNAVREYTTEHAAASRDAALALHVEIDERLAHDDPRRRSLSLLRELLG